MTNPLLDYKITRDLGIVTIYPANAHDTATREAFAVDLDETDLLVMLADLQRGE